MASPRHRDDIALCCKPLIEAGAELYEVGGSVRDALLGRPLKDRDLICRGLSFERIRTLLAPSGTVAVVGKSFGVLKFSPRRLPDLTLDIALPRRERSTGPGHRDFAVEADPSLPVEEDLGRRDFTINAMAISLVDGRVLDPFGGQADLEARILRQVFPRTFEEDPLRLVRAVQFAARFGLTIEAGTLAAMQEHAPLVATVPGERVSLELAKLMGAPEPSKGFILMRETGLLAHVLPELAALAGIEQDKWPGDDVFAHTMRVLDAARGDPEVEGAGHLDLLFAALLHDIGKARTARYDPASKRTVFFGHQRASARLARRWMERVKLATAGVSPERIAALIEQHMFETKARFTDRAIRRFVAKVGPDLIFLLLDLRLADNRGGKHPSGIKGVVRLRSRIRAELAKKPPFGPKDLAIDGHDLMAMGIPEGPLVGHILAALVERVLDEPERNLQEELLALAREIKESSALRAEKETSRRRKERTHGEEEDVDVPDGKGPASRN